ncbi:hypothetical protein [Catalinimonas niigatensis]|uniref:hypothetical protein n=1 Tax=Catalinimonas niigatensis TaxID=1397264 RepID=UPI00266609FD|nr:hypothetical protein [Catalinimonas niigatensis]WPP50540.1 hypothetical protein PZB72_28145 [Catalinimonas niigatensis]
MTQANLILTVEAATFSALHHKEILKQFHACSYDPASFRQAESLCQKYRALEHLRLEGQSRAREASHNLREARRQLKLRYIRHLSIARLTFKNVPEHWEKMGLNSERFPDLQSWIKQAQRFYYHAKPIGEQSESYGIPRHELEEVSQMLGQLAELSYLRKQAINYMEMINQQEQECYVALEQWMRDFTSAAQSALATKPQLLEALGFFTKTTAA